MKIKVCGLKREVQIDDVSTLVDYIGFIFYDKSPRYTTVAKSSKGHAKRVGVFVNASMEHVISKIESEKLDVAQLHGNESSDYCNQLLQYCEVIKAFGLHDEFDFERLIPYQGNVSYYLFDTKTVNHGGSGKTFNWEVLQRYTGEKPFFLSGGITPETAELIKKLNHPMLFGLDINSGFENSPANKNIDLIKTFIHDINS